MAYQDTCISHVYEKFILGYDKANLHLKNGHIHADTSAPARTIIK